MEKIETENIVKNLLLSTKREGVENLIKFMEERNFFTSPGSIKYHGNYEGGLLDHSYNLYKMFKEMNDKFNLKIPEETIIITSLLHDLCKANLYTKEFGRWVWNRFVGSKGHAKYSIERIERFIKLTDQERDIIKFHMGMYGSKQLEYRSGQGEYEISEVRDAFNNKLNKLFYFCDDMVAQFVDEMR